ncbi:MAG: hypothetical protein R3F15_06755 [Lysobacterales bacterium]
METNPVIPESFIGDIRKVADEVKRLSEGVACLPGDIAKIPAESFALFTQLRDEFDKAHVIRNRLLQALEDAERIVGGVLDAVEKAGEDLLSWVDNNAAVAMFRNNLQTFFDQSFEIPASAGKVKLPGLVGDLVALPLAIDRLAIPFEQDILNAIIQNLPAELLYPIHLGLEHAGDWYELPGRLNAQLQTLAEMSDSAADGEASLPSNELKIVVVASAIGLCNVINHLLEGVQAFTSRDTTVGVDIVGEGFSTTVGTNPVFLTMQLIRTVLQLIVDVLTALLAVLAAQVIK